MLMSRLIVTLVRLLDLYQLLIVMACIFTWIPRRPGSTFDDVASVIARLTEPWLSIFRQIIPPFGGMDFSPVVALIALRLIEQLLVHIL